MDRFQLERILREAGNWLHPTISRFSCIDKRIQASNTHTRCWTVQGYHLCNLNSCIQAEVKIWVNPICFCSLAFHVQHFAVACLDDWELRHGLYCITLWMVQEFEAGRLLDQRDGWRSRLRLTNTPKRTWLNHVFAGFQVLSMPSFIWELLQELCLWAAHSWWTMVALLYLKVDKVGNIITTKESLSPHDSKQVCRQSTEGDSLPVLPKN